ncbi:hypothetical protein PN36_16205 [Candidatus Thiomargarita nelsonii]|uniref:Nucleotidyltransferase family protein n=1 Tax=Candidatus Thiomargarita nelsonii TaxID=1003181 RepID=A0A0A6PAN1_9GAMM|nr:hypothetical protein PN36_16205 [Candidatus Thiomargarita nelsonii]
MNDLNTFLLICRCLAFEDNSESLRKQFQQVAWEKLVKVSSQYWVTQALYWSLSKKGLLNALPNDGLIPYFETILAANRDRNQRILAQLHSIATQLNQVGIEPLFMKGVASLATGIYEDVGIRMTGDIDLLVPENKLMDSVAILEKMGYRVHDTNCTFTKIHHHYTSLVCDGEPAAVDLHRRLFSRVPKLLPAKDVWHDAMSFQFHNARVKLPSPHHRIQHNIVHTYLEDRHYRKATISLRQLYEFAMLRQSLEEELDWQKLAISFKLHGKTKIFHNYVAMAHYLLAQPMPDAIPLSKSTTKNYRRFQDRKNHQWFANILDFKIYLLSALRASLISPKFILKLLQLSWYSKKIRILKKRLWNS